MRWILLCACLLLPLAQAEVLPEKMIQHLAANVHGGCLKVDMAAVQMSAEEQAKACGCSRTLFIERLRTTQVTSTRNPTDADQAVVQAVEAKGTNECFRPYVERKLAGEFKTICMAPQSQALAFLKKLGGKRREAACSCAAQDLAKDPEMMKLPSMPDDKKRADRMYIKWMAALDTCGIKF
ncbi:hypothetical protein [Pseudoduganella sp.]|uniref:hypothetical protein n=1 Tax=Pseudoduganella sp. TaxID=1880898 RepID=UPI0035B0D6DF